jgi:hypothetical protein
MTDPKPLSFVINQIRDTVERRSSTDFSIYYDDYTIYGDLNYIRSKVRAAWEKKTQENYKESDYKLEAEDTITRPDLVSGELEYAIERCNKLLDKIDEPESDQYNIIPEVREFKKIIESHKKAADNGEIIYN